MEKLNLTQLKHTFINQKKCTTQNKHKKRKPGLVASYNIQHGNGEGLFWFWCFIICHLLTYGPRAHTGPISEKLLTNDIYYAQEAYCNKLQFFADSRAPRFVFVLLKCSQDVLTDRLQRRGGHFFDASLLQSQLDTFQEPLENEFDLITDGTRTVSEIVDIIISVL